MVVHSAEPSLLLWLPPHTLSRTFSASALVRLVPWLIRVTNLAVSYLPFLV